MLKLKMAECNMHVTVNPEHVMCIVELAEGSNIILVGGLNVIVAESTTTIRNRLNSLDFVLA
jgi:hypothetical protein